MKAIALLQHWSQFFLAGLPFHGVEPVGCTSYFSFHIFRQSHERAHFRSPYCLTSISFSYYSI
jgi:hypothetical protein